MKDFSRVAELSLVAASAWPWSSAVSGMIDVDLWMEEPGSYGDLP